MTTNNAAQPGDGHSDGRGDANNEHNTLDPFERDHLVFLVHVPRLIPNQYFRFLYVELGDAIQPNSLGGGAHRGHRFSVNIMPAGDTRTPDGPGNGGGAPLVRERVVASQPCQYPFRRYPRGRMRPIGRVRRDACPDDIRQVCEEVDQADLDCCHNWTDAAIRRLRNSGVLRELRSLDDPAVRFGVAAVNDGTF